MKILIDMNLSPRWAAVLADAGFEATHWSTVGAANASDFALMDYAREQGMVVLTHDLDFSAILAATQGRKPSVMQVRADDVSPAAISKSVIGAFRQLGAEFELGALVSVDPKRIRLRLLPLGTRV